MRQAAVSRLPKVRSLSQILPKGTEGGKEFARIVDLLLINEARLKGGDVTVFDDAAGDYESLDSFSRVKTGGERVGYQYKFFPSPLTAQHRSSIRSSLEAAAKNAENSKITRWVIVTPDDLTNSGRRKDGGDVTWFEKLRENLPSLEIEHVGHSKLQHLFMQSPQLALYYYPEIVPEGAQRRTTIAAIRRTYDAALREQSGRIEFVGMSVYKEEATKGVPLERIYIPLSIVGEDQDDSDDNFPRRNPLGILGPGERSVVLGDPGSGKSTMLSFLALSRVSAAVQKRYKVDADDRLPIVVTLRRYADELKERFNLSLLDYITEVARADFSLNDCSASFFDFYLETGRAIALFDGLDELPNSRFKTTVRDRIRSFGTRYPQATIIVTSRIVGYEGEVRFPVPFSHFRMARLRLTEIETFIGDWYAARIENEAERRANVADLARIIRNPDSSAIRDLARNPLLLTIVALVHRIDAVLPDERVVLYQKCTETLLNTWYRWKFKDEDEKSKGRIERRNRRRIEAIAFWMQSRSVNAEKGRAVVPMTELSDFLQDFIVRHELLPKGDAEDQAEEFLSFVKSRTGMLIEVGDALYSFLHLTFQEYLAATYLLSRSELEGVPKIWEMIGADFDNPRWHEVARLLVASLKSEEGQRFFLDRLLEGGGDPPASDNALLLGGMVLDGIEPAERVAQIIVERIFHSAFHARSGDDLRALERTFRSWVQKDEVNAEIARSAFTAFKDKEAPAAGIGALLTGVALGVDSEMILADPLLRRQPDLFGAPAEPALRLIQAAGVSPKRLTQIHDLHDDLCRHSPNGNLYVVAMLPIVIAAEPSVGWERLFRRLLALTLEHGSGPYYDFVANILAISNYSHAPTRNDDPSVEVERRLNSLFEYGHQPRLKSSLSGTAAPTPLMLLRIAIRDYRKDRSKSRERTRRIGIERRLDELDFAVRSGFESGAPASFWQIVQSSSVATRMLSESTVQDLSLEPSTLWEEVSRSRLLSELSGFMRGLIDDHAQRYLADTILKQRLSPQAAYHVGFLILMTLWSESVASPRERYDALAVLGKAASRSDAAAVQLALAVRALGLGAPDSEDRIRRLLENT